MEHLLAGGELAEDVLEDAAVLVVENLLRGVDAQGGGELDGAAGESFGEDGEDAAVGELGVEHGLELAGGVADREDLLAAEAERGGGLAGEELQGEDTHADQIRPVDALVGLRDDELDAEQPRAFG